MNVIKPIGTKKGLPHPATAPRRRVRQVIRDSSGEQHGHGHPRGEGAVSDLLQVDERRLLWLGCTQRPRHDGVLQWSNFSDTYDNRTYFKYGTPPLIGLIPGTTACQYNSDGTPTGVLYGQTWSANQIGINTTLLDLFVKALDDRTDDADLLIETVNGTVLHEMVHWSYYKEKPVDEKKKYGGDEEHGTTKFELEAFGHPIRLPLERMCVVKTFPYLGIKSNQKTRPAAQGSYQVVEVTDVDPKGPAAKAGIRKGDVIRKFDGDEIWANGGSGFDQQLQKKKPGQVVKIELERGSQTLTVSVTLAANTQGK
jgi:PDZ domain-containing protein